MKTNPTIQIGALSATLTCLLPSLATGGEKAATVTPDLAAPLCEERLLGDVWGLRAPAETGIDFRMEASNFYFGVLDGSGGSDVSAGGKLDLFFDMDGQKAGLWPGLFVNVHGEFRYGDLTRQAGVLSPVNTALIAPREDGEVFALTNVTVTQALSESFLVTIGKFNTIDMANKQYYGGGGTDKFMNLSFVAMPIGGRTFPISPLGAIATYLKDGAPFINVGVLDADSPETRPGWDGLNADELTFFSNITFKSKLRDLDGTHTLTGVFSTISTNSLAQSDLIHPPSEGGLDPNTANNSWMVNYLWEQQLTQDASDPTRGLGFFLFLGVSDSDPNPFAYSIAAGLVSKGVASRSCDTFGVGLFFNGVSGELKDTLSDTPAPIPSLHLQDEFGGEIFYDLAITPWFRVGADLQVIQPVIEDHDTAIFGGLRTRIVF
ncbi:MAG: carbohydrate porin [Lentisphaeria bacterium]|nr:carbohydrate porin [Lentisphaeria bacterium]